jgi:Protein of unknown function (DUF3788)
MQKPRLNDQSEFPDDAQLARCLGKAKRAWDSFAAGIGEAVPDASLEWRYYNDGKAWLCKVTRKKKTVCWVSVWDKSFKTTFYFTAKNDLAIEGLPIPSGLKDAYRANAPIGALKPLTVEVRNEKALDAVFVLAKYKVGVSR